MQTGLGFSNFLAQLDGVGMTVLILLLALSVASWYLILTKGISNIMVGKRADAFLKRFWSASSLQEVNSTLKDGSDDNAFAQLARQAMDAAVNDMLDDKISAAEAAKTGADKVNAVFDKFGIRPR